MSAKTTESPYRVTHWESLKKQSQLELRRTNSEWDAHFREMREQALARRAQQRQADAEKAWR